MFSDDILTALREASIEKECHMLEFQSFSMYVSCRIMQHILDCEEKGVESNIIELGLPTYPRTTGEYTSTIGDCFTA